jgi:hypothetical protein
LARLAGGAGFLLLLVGMIAILWGDDLQLVHADQEVPTVFNVRLAGIKIMDLLSAALFLLAVLKTALTDRLEWTSGHTAIMAMLATYLYAGIVGFLYSFGLRYDYTYWVQDLQQTLYMAGFFLITYILVDTKNRWRLFLVTILAVMAVKNVVILSNTFSGVGKAIGDWAFRASQNSEFAYFPMMFFPFLLLLLRRGSVLLRLLLALLVAIYLVNSLLGIYRTVWVMLILGTMALLILLPRQSRIVLSAVIGVGLTLSLAVISVLFPRFLELAWNFKFASIFDWSVYGERSNSTKLLEIVNVWDYVLSHFAFLHGMGLGAWWDDSARRLLPDGGSGFTHKTRFQSTHMWYVTQFLKLGLLAMVVYWGAVWHILRTTLRGLRSLPWDRWETQVLLGWFIGLLCAFVSSADFVRLFLMVGVNVAVSLRWLSLHATSSVPARS